jgi:RNA polymerase sigma factor (sigma-70 family)
MEITNYKPLIIYEAKRIFGKVDDDLIQEGYLVFLEAKKSFDKGRGVPFNAYLATRLRYRYLEMTRETKATLSLQGRRGEDGTLEDFLPGKENTEDQVLEMQVEIEIKQALNELSQMQHIIIIEIFFNNKKLPQIAKEQGITYETAKTHKKRAMKKLRGIILPTLKIEVEKRQ